MPNMNLLRSHGDSRLSSRQRLKDRERDRAPSAIEGVYKMEDDGLMQRFLFIEEIGFGNWGSVWLCYHRPGAPSLEDHPQDRNTKLAVKLVHRSGTATSAARFKSLWNEMKVIRNLGDARHPSIIRFKSFILTPSYAMITMPFHRHPIPVEVDEPHARIYIRALIDGVAFLHKHGIAHNDIKPANILISMTNVPVLIDFGFAETYDMSTVATPPPHPTTAPANAPFLSNLSYGTPEYLSPERAKGQKHDTRKSDVWALGVTCFEVLVGRTPFEREEGEPLASLDELKGYWERTCAGKWLGSDWRRRMSRPLEKMIKRMTEPNAQFRAYAWDILEDPYWASEATASLPVLPIATRTPGGQVAESNTKMRFAAGSGFVEKERLRGEKSKDGERDRPVSRTSRSSPREVKMDGILDVLRRHHHIDEPAPSSPSPVRQAKKAKDKENKSRAGDRGKENASVQRRHVERKPSSTKLKEQESPRSQRGPLSAFSPIQESSPTATSLSSARSATSLREKEKEKDKENRRVVYSNIFGTGVNREKLKAKEQGIERNSKEIDGRRPLGPRTITPPQTGAMTHSPVGGIGKRTARDIFSLYDADHAIRVEEIKVQRAIAPPSGHTTKASGQADQRSLSNKSLRHTSRSDISGASAKNATTSKKDTAVERMREWEKERQRLRAMAWSEDEEEDSGEQGKEDPEEAEQPQDSRYLEDQMRQDAERQRILEEQLRQEQEQEQEKLHAEVQARDEARLRQETEERGCHRLEQDRVAEEIADDPPQQSETLSPTPLSPVMEEPHDSRFEDSSYMHHGHSRDGSSLSMSMLRQSFKLSIGKARELYKSSTLAMGRSTPMLSFAAAADEDAYSRLSFSDIASWSDHGESQGEARARSSVAKEDGPDESPMDRMTLWIRSVEKVVEDARQSFAPPLTPPPLPIPHMRTSMFVSGEKRSAETRHNSSDAHDIKNGRNSKYCADTGTDTLASESGLLSPAGVGRDAEGDTKKSSRKTSRTSRKILPANQIFAEGYESYLSVSMSASAAGSVGGCSVAPDLSLGSGLRASLSTKGIYSQSISASVSTSPPSPAPIVQKDQPYLDVQKRSRCRSKSFANSADPSMDIPNVPSEVTVPVAPSLRHERSGTPPPRPRRQTIVTRSPEAPRVRSGYLDYDEIDHTQRRSRPSLSIDVDSPSRRKEKSRSHNDLQSSKLGRPITPVSRLEFELEKLANPGPAPTLRLSALVDKDLLRRETFEPKAEERSNPAPEQSMKRDDLTASPLHVEPYPRRPVSQYATTMDSPAMRHVENVYDRFLMSTTGVKRVGKGYQSDNKVLSLHVGPKVPTLNLKRAFHSSRRPMPPPVSSDDVLKRRSSFCAGGSKGIDVVDEFGVVSCGQGAVPFQEATNTVGTMRRALKAIVTGKR